MRSLILLLSLCCFVGSCHNDDVAALRSEVAALKADNARLAQSPQEPTETQPYLVSLPHFPALGGVMRPQAQNWLATGDEICFDAKAAHQWFSALNRALGGGQQQQRRSP